MANIGEMRALATERTFALRDGGVWNTATVGGSTRLGPHTTVFAEAGVVLRGVAPAQDWIGGPAIAFVGVSREL